MRKLHKPQNLNINYIRESDKVSSFVSPWYNPTVFYLAMSAAAVNAQSNEEINNKHMAMEEVIVTSQRIEENIQTVPIAVTALTDKALGELKIERGDELLRATPNVTFSKGNFNRYNFSIRGVGTKSLSASSDPAVAVSFNNTPMLRNRLFEQEFFDVDRVEVLRGPQGTLYGRNATGGVVNMLPRFPTQEFEADIKSEVGSHNTRRIGGMFNLPLGDNFAARFSGAMTKRDGYDYNTVTGNDVNDRDLFSTRVIFEWTPTEKVRANLIWQHFEEDDKRSRTGKQLCTRDEGPASVGNQEIPDDNEIALHFTQGCKPDSLFADEAYGAPNADTLANYAWLNLAVELKGIDKNGRAQRLYDADGNQLRLFNGNKPYGGVNQSKDLREIATNYDPKFNAENDLIQLNMEFALADTLTLFTQSTYAKDDYQSIQDYSRYQSNPIFTEVPDVVYDRRGRVLDIVEFPTTSGGVYMDPQLGPSSGIEAVDLSRSDSEQWNHELRIQSAYDGNVNFSLGVNYLDFETSDDYFLFNNLYNAMAEFYLHQFDEECTDEVEGPCMYVDKNDLDNIDEEGHNYFYGPNAVATRSYAAFGEFYWQLSEDVKLTTGVRYTADSKTTTPYPTQVLLMAGPNGETDEVITGGTVRRGLEADPEVVQRWDEFTGRAVLDWQTETPFTDETMFYLSVARGYKGGGTNPPRIGIDPEIAQYREAKKTFDPEYVNAFELGTKNSLLENRMTLNATVFYYDYKNYQIARISDRSTINENFDTTSFGLELETLWQATQNTRFNAALGYLKTRVGKGEKSVDVMNRTNGNEDWILLRPFFASPSSCIAPTALVEEILSDLKDNPFGNAHANLFTLCPGMSGGLVLDPKYNYDPLVDAPNQGRGWDADLSGNELPNSPNYTFNFGMEHIVGIQNWDLRLRADYYYQGESYARVYNTEYDRLEDWDNLNVSATLVQPEWDLQVELYVKNVFDDAPIVDAFTNADDVGLSTNVFTLDPRIIGLSVYKAFGN
ncbi:TonB-dependent receptor [uncultured Microbulbifer sp.]|uniref:TonB-dependent receptor n=1 Tax=uncultured Microbulbifer sp. TaxID=348147 RepID=UPI002622DCE7|nr:TonB-dependent receptor [uncultured Microbulbifer sp.]